MPRLSLAKLERHLYGAADILRREGMDAATYKDYIFGLLFLKRCSEVFAAERDAVVGRKVEGGMFREIAETQYGENPDYYDTFFVPERARWSYLQEHLNDSDQPYGNDLADLVAPRHVILCEGGRPEAGARKNAEFDAKCLNAIFRREFPDVLFVSAGGTNDLERNALLLAGVLTNVVPGVTVTRLLDRDDRSDAEIAERRTQGVRVLSLRDIENYLWDDEVLTKLCQVAGKPEQRDAVLAVKQSDLQTSIGRNNPSDDIKSASGPLSVRLKQLLGLTQCGNSKEAFCVATLVPLVTSDTQAYAQLKAGIFGEKP